MSTRCTSSLLTFPAGTFPGQWMMHGARFAPAMASSNAVTLFAGVILGAVVYGETLSHGGGQLAPAIIGLVLAVAGVVLLARAEGPTAGQTPPGDRVPAPAP